jgi:hypothetical protein
LAAAERAAQLWSAVPVGLEAVAGTVPPQGREEPRTIYVSEGSLARFGDERTGNAHSWRYGPVLSWVRVEVLDCANVQLVSHELGHGLGFRDVDDPSMLMSGDLYRESWAVPDAWIAAYERAVSP